MTDPEMQVRRSAVDALWQLDTLGAEDALALALADPDGEIRSRAAKALGDLYKGNAAGLLHYLEDEETVGSISRVLIHLGEEGTERALVRALGLFGDCLLEVWKRDAGKGSQTVGVQPRIHGHQYAGRPWQWDLGPVVLGFTMEFHHGDAEETEHEREG